MSTSHSMRESSSKLSILRLAATFSVFMAISFVLCVLAGYLLPGLRGSMPVSAFPDFSWEHPLSAVHGMVWSMGVGVYVGVLFGVLYNSFGGLK